MEGPKVALTGVPAASLFRSLAIFGWDFDGFILGNCLMSSLSRLVRESVWSPAGGDATFPRLTIDMIHRQTRQSDRIHHARR